MHTNSSKLQIAANPWRPQSEKEKINDAVELHKMQNMETENDCTMKDVNCRRGSRDYGHLMNEQKEPCQFREKHTISSGCHILSIVCILSSQLASNIAITRFAEGKILVRCWTMKREI
ncbi:hypothetical protein WR25_17255 [Diploscapter pachys]|uniref:Uncharacterized protein n=1 Tax=Diploscapter pachys TaxID=2018661 RepID=A0A2A2LRB3_9BILA|nr:hypothetical protein WR25_17255 [Diploscapter pachys]